MFQKLQSVKDKKTGKQKWHFFEHAVDAIRKVGGDEYFHDRLYESENTVFKMKFGHKNKEDSLSVVGLMKKPNSSTSLQMTLINNKKRQFSPTFSPNVKL